MRSSSIIKTLSILLIASQALATNYHVTTTGTTGADGLTVGTAWSLFRSSNAALGFTPMPTGGDTVWIHGGVYNITATWEIACSGGTAGNPIVWRNWNNERVQIVSQNGNLDWTVALGSGGVGVYNWIWGLEVWSNRDPAIEAAVIAMNMTGVATINCYVHDGDMGYANMGITSTIMYGCIINYNGRMYWAPTGEGPGYGSYNQNINQPNTRKKYIQDNIMAFNWSWGNHTYTEASSIDSFVIEGNAVYNNGLFWRYPTWQANTIFTAPDPRNRYLQQNNNIYYAGLERSKGSNYMMLYFPGTASLTSATITNNFMISAEYALYIEADGGSNTITGNVFVGGTSGLTSYTNNTFITSGWPSTRPDDIIVRKNAYESNRANIYVLNYDESATVSVNPNANGTVLSSGNTYVIKDGLNYAGANVTSGTWTSGNITIPMEERRVG